MQADTLLPQIAYYASLSAAKEENNVAVKKYAPYARDDKEVGKFALEFLATAYKSDGDTAQWISILKEGVTKYPDHTFFFGHLIDYYSNKSDFDEAMEFTNTMLASDPNNSFFHYVKGYLYHNKKDYDDAIEYYKKTIELDPTNAEAYSNLGLIYCLKAQEFSDQSTTNINDPLYAKAQADIRKFYEEAKPYYEKARELKPDTKELWLQGLYRVYYSLNMKEFDEIEELMQ
jgi:tetratricopeptide (TPR) repeat protein